MSQEDIPHIRKPNGRVWIRASDQVAAQSIEWIPCGKVLNMAEFNIRKSPGGLTDKTLIIDKNGSLKTSNEYDQISLRQNALKVGKLPYFLKISKIREIIYVPEGAFSLKTYKVWRNRLYKAGCADALLSTDNRLLTIEELERVDQYFWDSVFETSSRKKYLSRTKWKYVSLHQD